MSRHYSHKQHISLQVYIPGYLQELSSQGYTEITQDHYRADLLRLIIYAEHHGIHSAKQFSIHAHNLISGVSDNRWLRRCMRSTMNRFIAYLVQQRIIPDPTIVIPKTRYAQLTMEFVKFQIEHRGVCREYAKGIRKYCGCFFDYLQSRGIRRLNALAPETVLDFITDDSKKYMRKTVSSRSSALRSLLTYLYRKGAIRRDLSGIVIGPRIYKNEACPKFISTSQINTILLQIDRTTTIGMRDYAMAILLATYGLRGIEVIRLCLDDIDWRSNLIHIKARKAGNNSVYPLSSDVTDAMLQYLKHARPQSDNRQIFLAIKAPYSPLVYTAALGIKLRMYMMAAGIKIARPGTHTFRYSCAQSLLKQNTPLKVISDYLGHMQPGTTQQYLKIAVDDLRGVACGDGEEVIL